MSRPETVGKPETMLDRVLEHLARRGAETRPYIPPPVERWNAKVINFPSPHWNAERQRAVATQAMALALKAQESINGS